MGYALFILVEGVEDWPHPVPVAHCSGTEDTAPIAHKLCKGLQAEFRDEAPALKFSCVDPDNAEDLLALISKLDGSRDRGEFGEQVQAICRAADFQLAFLEVVDGT
jgi:hypothetical protein